MTTIKLTPRQTELLRAFFEHDGSVKTKWGRLADSIGMERTAAAVQFGYLLGKLKATVAAPEGYGHAAAGAPSTVTTMEEGPDEYCNTTTVPAAQSAAATTNATQADGAAPIKYNKTCRGCYILQQECEKIAGSDICKNCGQKRVACELVPRKQYSTLNRPKRKATTTATAAADGVAIAAAPPAKRVKITAPEAAAIDSAARAAVTQIAALKAFVPVSRSYFAVGDKVDNKVSDDPDA